MSSSAPSRSGPGPELLDSASIAPGTIVFSKVSKSFRRSTASKKSYTTIKSRILTAFRLQPPEPGSYIRALKELSLTVAPGRALGVIGRNGSGKSTLLKLIAGIYRTDQGTVRTSGKLSALIELGAGFHPDFTGRENIYLGGVMFGLKRKEIDERFDEIVRFAELEDFIDDPVRTYSSGMYMRLGFSLAVHTDPDILLIDEVLAVGDASFIHRCQERISEFKRRGKTLLFVTHDLDSVVRWCDEVVWLDKGVVKDRGEPRRVVDAYLAFVENQEEQALDSQRASSEAQAEEATDESVDELASEEEKHRWGSGEVEILQVRVLDSNGAEKRLFHENDTVQIEADYKVNSAVADLVFGIGLVRSDGVVALGTNTQIEGLKLAETLSLSAGSSGSFRIKLPRLSLTEGAYFVDVAAHQSDGTPYDYHHLMHQFSVRNKKRYHGIAVPEHQWVFSPGVAKSGATTAPQVANISNGEK